MKKNQAGQAPDTRLLALVSETEQLAKISAAPMSKLSRLRANFLEDKMS